MRRAAILCPGPSLRQTWQWSDFVEYPVTIGVNHACGAFRVDWLCAGDLPTIARLRRLPDVGLIVPRNVWASLTTGEGASYWAEGQPWNPEPWARLALIAWESLTLADNETPCNYSAVAALAAACAWHPDPCTRVDIYGADMRGTDGVDGTTGENRSDERWARERRDLRAVARRALHVRINRILPLPE